MATSPGYPDLASGTGYVIQFNAESGQQCGQLFVMTSVGGNPVLTPMGTFSQPPNAANLPSGLHTVSCIITGTSDFQLWIDGILQCTAQDSTYTNYNTTFYGSPNATTSAVLGPTRVLSPAVYVVDIASLKFAKVTNPAIYGATHADYVDTFFVLNQPGLSGVLHLQQQPRPTSTRRKAQSPG